MDEEETSPEIDLTDPTVDAAIDEQIEFAHELVEFMDVEESLCALDLLDALASAGLKLALDGNATTSLAYMRELRRPASEAAPNN